MMTDPGTAEPREWSVPRPQWDYDLSELCGGSSDPDAGKLANRIEAHIRGLEREAERLRVYWRPIASAPKDGSCFLIDRATADALSALTKEVEARDKALEYSLTLCDQFVDGLAWSDYDMRVIASTELALADLRALSNLRSVVAQSLSRADGGKGSEGQ